MCLYRDVGVDQVEPGVSISERSSRAEQERTNMGKASADMKSE
jgi:hypothetical protein